jgi:hypothetical protein
MFRIQYNVFAMNEQYIYGIFEGTGPIYVVSDVDFFARSINQTIFNISLTS